MHKTEAPETELSTPGHLTALMRHFIDLRDGTHGGSVSRSDKETHFAHAVELVEPIARRALGEINTHLLLETGKVVATGLRRESDGSLSASWGLTWPEQKTAGVAPVTLYAYYGSTFLHPHLRGATVRDWPLNIFSLQDATDLLPILRAIATSDLHNLVFKRIIESYPPSRDHRLVLCLVRSSTDIKKTLLVALTVSRLPHIWAN
jgi:hypothetical protein